MDRLEKNISFNEICLISADRSHVDSRKQCSVTSIIEGVSKQRVFISPMTCLLDESNYDKVKDSKFIPIYPVRYDNFEIRKERMLKGKPEWIIVSKDALREGKGDYWILVHEQYIKSLEIAAVFCALKENLNVVIDGTNFNPTILDNWKRLADQFKAEIEIKKFPISFEEALKRDTERGLRGGRAVGEAAIRHFFDRYNLYNSLSE